MSLSKLAEVYQQTVILENKDLTHGQTAPGDKFSPKEKYIEGSDKEGHGGTENVELPEKPEERKEKGSAHPSKLGGGKSVVNSSFDPFEALYNKILANEDFGNWEAAEDAMNNEEGGEGGGEDVSLNFTGEVDGSEGEEGEGEGEEGEEELGLSSGGLGDVIKHLQAAVEALQALQGGGEPDEDEDYEDEEGEEDLDGEGGEEGGEGGEEDLSEESVEGDEGDEGDVNESCETTIIGHALTTGFKKLQAGLNDPKNNKPNFGLPKPPGGAKVSTGTKAHEMKVLVKDIGKKAVFNKLQKGHKVDKTAGSHGYDSVGSNYGYGKSK